MGTDISDGQTGLMIRPTVELRCDLQPTNKTTYRLTYLLTDLQTHNQAAKTVFSVV